MWAAAKQKLQQEARCSIMAWIQNCDSYFVQNISEELLQIILKL